MALHKDRIKLDLYTELPMRYRGAILNFKNKQTGEITREYCQNVVFDRKGATFETISEGSIKSVIKTLKTYTIENTYPLIEGWYMRPMPSSYKKLPPYKEAWYVNRVPARQYKKGANVKNTNISFPTITKGLEMKFFGRPAPSPFSGSLSSKELWLKEIALEINTFISFNEFKDLVDSAYWLLMREQNYRSFYALTREFALLLMVKDADYWVGAFYKNLLIGEVNIEKRTWRPYVVAGDVKERFSECLSKK